jgi:hypothetical protein
VIDDFPIPLPSGQKFSDPSKSAEDFESRRTGRRTEILKILVDSLGDPYTDIREIATKKIMILAESGDMIASQAVLENIDTCFELGIGSKTLGFSIKEMPGADLPEKSHNKGEREIKSSSEKSRHDLLVKRAMEELTLLSEMGFVSKIRDIAFPPERPMRGVLARPPIADTARASLPEVRAAAAEALLQLAQGGNENATLAIAENLDDFFSLAGLGPLGERSAAALSEMQERDYGLTRAKTPNLVELVSDMRSDPQSAEAVYAATQLLRLAEQGDGMASTAIVRNIDAFLAGVTRAGIFRGQIRSASQALRGFIK